jgi:hypothetical protein
MLHCREDLAMQSEAAKVVRGGESRNDLLARCKRRRIFIDQLATEVCVLDGKARAAVALPDDSCAALRRARSRVIGRHDGDIYAACARVEVDTAERYAAVRLASLPQHAARLVARQHVEIEQDRNDLRRDSWSH